MRLYCAEVKGERKGSVRKSVEKTRNGPLDKEAAELPAPRKKNGSRHGRAAVRSIPLQVAPEASCQRYTVPLEIVAYERREALIKKSLRTA